MTRAYNKRPPAAGNPEIDRYLSRRVHLPSGTARDVCTFRDEDEREREGARAARKRALADPAVRARMSAASKRAWADPAVRARRKRGRRAAL